MPETVRLGFQIYWNPKTSMAGASDRTGTPVLIGDANEEGIKLTPEYTVAEQMAPRLGINVRTHAEVTSFKLDIDISFQTLFPAAWAAIVGTDPKAGAGADATHGVSDKPGQYGWLKCTGYKGDDSMKVNFEVFCLLTAESLSIKPTEFMNVPLKFRVIGATSAAMVVKAMAT